MSEIEFQIQVEGKLQTAILRFADGRGLQRYQRNLSRFARESSGTIQEAVELTRLAAKRWRDYSRSGEFSESLTALMRIIRQDNKSEVAFVMVATIWQKRREIPVGMALCRRTWCHHLALDFLALHPRALQGDWHVSGIGSGMAFGLVQLARTLNISRIWGEATSSSAPFYEKLLDVSQVQDLFVVEAMEMSAIVKRQEKLRALALVPGPTIELH